MKFFYGTFRNTSANKNLYVPIVAKHRYDAIKYMKEFFGGNFQHVFNLKSSEDFKQMQDKYSRGALHDKRNTLIFSIKSDELDVSGDISFESWFILSKTGHKQPLVNTFLNLLNHKKAVLIGNKYKVYNSTEEVIMFNPTSYILNLFFKGLYPPFIKGGKHRYIEVGHNIRRIQNIYIDATLEYFRINALIAGPSPRVSPVFTLFEFDFNKLDMKIDLIPPHTYKNYDE